MSDQEQKELEEQLSNAPLEIEITEDAELQNDKPEAVEEQPPQEDKEFSKRVQKRISTLVQQRKQAEADAEVARGEVTSLKTRLDRLEQGNTQQAYNQFVGRYEQAKQGLAKAIEEGNTEDQVAYQEQMADMRAAQRVAEMQKQTQVNNQVSPTVGRAAQVEQAPTPTKAIDWWQKNRWFNSSGFERETAAARAIDVQLDLEGYDKESDDYYTNLDNRLRKMFPELISGGKVEQSSRPRTKSRSPVAPTAGGSSRRSNRVRMSKEQLQMARELGITDEKALRAYEAEIQAKAQEANNG